MKWELFKAKLLQTQSPEGRPVLISLPVYLWEHYTCYKIETNSPYLVRVLKIYMKNK
jgi:hypothetical protein